MKPCKKEWIILVALAANLSAQDSYFPRRESRPVYWRALATFKGLLNEKNCTRFGFESVEEIKTAELGEPIQEYIIKLDQLRNYKAGSDPSLLLSRSQIVIFPVIAGNRVRSSIQFAWIDYAWKAVAFGGTNTIRTYTDMRNALMVRLGRTEDDFFWVHVPWLGLRLIGHYEKEEIFLTPLAGIETLGLKTGVSQPLAGILAVLKPLADTYKEQSPLFK